MARYCFYCGRELSSGEKCNCRSSSHTEAAAGSAGSASSESAGSSRTAGTGSAAHTTHAAHGSGRPKSSGNRKHGAFGRFFQSINPFAGGSSSQPRTSRPSHRARPAARTRQPITAQSVLLSLQKAVAYITRPADVIRESILNGSRHAVFALLLLQSALSGLFLMTAVRQPMVRTLLTLNIATVSGTISAGDSLFLFVQGFGIALAASLLLALLYHLALKYLYRTPVAYLELLAAFSPASLYFSLFLLVGLLSMSSSIFSALLLMLAGFTIATVIQAFGIREVSGFDDNRTLVLVVFVMLIFNSVLSLLLNLSLPVLQALLEQSSVI